MGAQAKQNPSPLTPKDESLRKTIQASKLVKLALSQQETAKIAGISKSSVGHNKSNLINEFWSEESLTPDEDKKYLLEKNMESVDSLSTAWVFGRHLTKVHKYICRYKKKEKVSIHSEKNKSAKYLLKHKDNLDKLL